MAIADRLLPRPLRDIRTLPESEGDETLPASAPALADISPHERIDLFILCFQRYGNVSFEGD